MRGKKGKAKKHAAKKNKTEKRPAKKSYCLSRNSLISQATCRGGLGKMNS